MTTKAAILKAIRKNCIECSAGSMAAIQHCPMEDCPLFPYRMGKDPCPARKIKNLPPRHRVFTEETKKEERV